MSQWVTCSFKNRKFVPESKTRLTLIGNDYYAMILASHLRKQNSVKYFVFDHMLLQTTMLKDTKSDINMAAVASVV
jgi:hypothetical protein